VSPAACASPEILGCRWLRFIGVEIRSCLSAAALARSGQAEIRSLLIVKPSAPGNRMLQPGKRGKPSGMLRNRQQSERSGENAKSQPQGGGSGGR
jgi:hypothetical protein